MIWKYLFKIQFEQKIVLATRKDSKLDLTTHTTEHSVDLHAACPRCLAYEASKPGATDGESCDLSTLFHNEIFPFHCEHLKASSAILSDTSSPLTAK